MNKNNNLFLVVILLASLIVAARADQEQVAYSSDKPSRAVLAEIVLAFAFNLEADGNTETPLLIHTAHVGYVFDEFGRRSTLGQSYRGRFRAEFSALSDELQNALGVNDSQRPLPLTSERRAAAVKVLRDFAGRLKDGKI